MDLGPINSIRPFGTIEPTGTDLELPAVARVEKSSRPDKYSASRRQLPARPDDEIADSMKEPAAEPSDPGDEIEPGGNVSIFA
jgi:hypothetical protein